MKKLCSTVIVLLVVLAVLTLASSWEARPSSAAQPSQLPPKADTRVALILDTSNSTTPVWIRPPSGFSPYRPASAQINVNYIPAGQNNGYDTCEAWPADAQAAFNYAASIWSQLINSTVPMTINACWYGESGPTLGYNFLGYSSANFPNRPRADTWYAPALANALAGSDQTPGAAETNIAINKNFTWYTGLDGSTPGGLVDMVSVVLHEIGHGLGFTGGMRYNRILNESCSGASGTGCWGSYPYAYDWFTENGSGTTLLSLTNPSTNLGNQLIGENLWWNGNNAQAANGGNKVKIYAPAPGNPPENVYGWMPGSSYSHLDYDTFKNTGHRLMVYALSAGTSVHDPGAVTMGILKDVGWTMGTLASDVSIVKQVAKGGVLQPGDAITFTLSIANNGNTPAANARVTDTIAAQVLNRSFTSTLRITQTGVTDYVWNVEPLAIGRSGVITIYGQITPGLGSNFAFINTAAIGDPQDNTPANNSSTVIVGGYRIYLPLVAKNY